jgi:phosphatidylinositol alpha-1,6-mannosyltransferase
VNETVRLPDIVLITPDFRPHTGGVAEYLHNLFDHVASRYPVTVLSTVPVHGHSWQHAYRLEILAGDRSGRSRVGGVFPLNKLTGVRRRFASRRSADRLVRAIEASSGPNRRVYVGWWSTASHWWCRALRESGVEYSIFAYGTELVKSIPSRAARWRSEDFGHAAEVIAISEGTADLVRARVGAGPEIRLVRPGVVPVSSAGGGAHSARLQPAWNLDDSRLLLTVGRLIPRKGVDLVMHSVARLAARYPDLTYAVAGTGPDEPRLRGLARQLNIADRVRFLGRVDEETKAALYGLADVFVLPNRLMNGEDWEGFGIVFLEAATAGTPSIGGDNGGVRDAIVHGETGLLVDPESEDDLTEALHRLLGDVELRQRMGRAARRRASEEFDWRRIAETFVASFAGEDDRTAPSGIQDGSAGFGPTVR